MKKELLRLLKSLGFKQEPVKETIIFVREDNKIIVLPKGRLLGRHYSIVRTFLDAWGYMDKRDFTKRFFDVMPLS